MALINPTLPTIGDPNSTEDLDTRNALSTIVTAINGNIDDANVKVAAAIAGSKLADPGVTDAKLASPNNAAYRRLTEARGVAGSALAAGTYYFSADRVPHANGTNTSLGVEGMIELAAADLAVPGKTTKVRVRLLTLCNPTAPSATFSGELRQLTALGGSPGAIAHTFGAVLVATPTITPIANSAQTAVSAGPDATSRLALRAAGHDIGGACG